MTLQERQLTSSYVCCLGDAFGSVAEACPDRPAIVLEGGFSVSYRELEARANILVIELRRLGVRRGDAVAMFHSKSRDGYAAMIACVKIGAAHVNLDDQNPPSRLASILDTCCPRIVVADGQVQESSSVVCQKIDRPIVALSALGHEEGVEARSGAAAYERPIASDVAYVMFTSGSTGVPKGVAISHAQVLNLIAWARQEFAIKPGDILTNVNPMYFDNSIFDFYAALFNGAAIAPIGRELVAQPKALVERVASTGCTLWFSVPSLLIYLMTMKVFPAANLSSLRAIAFGGEGYPKQELAKLHSLFSGRARLVNVYGPTECTCICSAYDVTESDLDSLDGLPPIGRLAPNFRGLLLDGYAPVPPGEIGELCLIGPNVGLGYYRDPERTSVAFVLNPCCDTHAERMYRTGDLMRVHPESGLLHFVGRVDNQIKHMGYRIELEEIEAAIGRIEGVEQCAVVYKRGQGNFGRVVAFVSSRSADVIERVILDVLRQELPNYMIPQRVLVRDSLPKNANGKLDRKLLSEEA